MLRQHNDIEKAIEKAFGYSINFADKLAEYTKEEENGKQHTHVVLTSFYVDSKHGFHEDYEGMIHVGSAPSHPKIMLVVVADNGALFYWNIYSLVKEVLQNGRVTIDFFDKLKPEIDGLKFKSADFTKALTTAILAA